MACAGQLIKEAPYHFSHIATTPTPWLCIPDSPAKPPRMVWYDEAQSKQVDFAALKADNYAAFVAQDRLTLALQEEMAAAGASQEVRADVWLDVDHSGLLAPDGDQAARAAAKSKRLARIASAASGFIQRVNNDGLNAHAVRFGPRTPIVSVRATSAILHSIGGLPGVVRVSRSIQEEVEESKLFSENYISLTESDFLDSAGYNGSGVTVDVLEGDRPFWIANLVLPSGSCSGVDFIPYECSDATMSPFAGWHSRSVMAVMRNSVTANMGVADGITGIFSNGTWPDAVNWGLDHFASVFNRSAGPNPPAFFGPPQTATDIYLDYVAMWSSTRPTITISAGNHGVGKRTSNSLRNGLVVGGTTDGASLGSLNMYNDNADNGSQAANSGGANGWELPHVVAVAQHVDVSGQYPGTTTQFGGTSAAAPQVAGIVAALQQANPALIGHPEVMMAGIMAGASGNPDANLGGTWPLDLDDGIDDADGAGFVRGLNSWYALSSGSRHHGGEAATNKGYDWDVIWASTTPEYSYYYEFWNVRAYPGETIRVAGVFSSWADCPSPAGQYNCTGNPYPLFILWLRDASTGAVVDVSADYDSNYEFVSATNNTGAAHDYYVQVEPVYWNGLPGEYFGIAWSDFNF